MKKLIVCIVCLVLFVPVVAQAQLFREKAVKGVATVPPEDLTDMIKSEFSPHCTILEQNRKAAWVIMMCPYFPIAEKHALESKPPDRLFHFPYGTPLKGSPASKFVPLPPSTTPATTSTTSPDYGEVTDGTAVVNGIEWRTCEYAIPRLPNENTPNPYNDPTKSMMCAVRVRIQQRGATLYLHSGLANLYDVEACKYAAKQPLIDGFIWLQDILKVDDFDASRYTKSGWIVSNSSFLRHNLIDTVVVKAGGLPIPGGRKTVAQQKIASEATVKTILTVIFSFTAWLGIFLVFIELLKRLFQTRNLKKIWYIIAFVAAVLLAIFLNLWFSNIAAWAIILIYYGFYAHRSHSRQPEASS